MEINDLDYLIYVVYNTSLYCPSTLHQKGYAFYWPPKSVLIITMFHWLYSFFSKIWTFTEDLGYLSKNLKPWKCVRERLVP